MRARSPILFLPVLLAAIRCGGRVSAQSDEPPITPWDAAVDSDAGVLGGIDSGPDALDGCLWQGVRLDPLQLFTGPDGCQCMCLEGGTMTCMGLTCKSAPQPRSCDYFGTGYAVADVWDCSDGCNLCFCTETGAFSTTGDSCEPAAWCETGGVSIAQGSHVLAPDGCNLCTCWKDGELRCTTTWFCLAAGLSRERGSG